MTSPLHPSGTFALGGDLAVSRIGFGAMQLSGLASGAGREREILRTAIGLGVNHIDTSDYYGRHVVNDLIRRSLAPYPDGLTIVTKVGYELTAGGMLRPATTTRDLTDAVHDNLNHLGVDRLDVVNLRMSPESHRDAPGIAGPFSVLAGLQSDGLIRHLGISNVTADQLVEARKVAPVVCVQNRYSVTDRGDDAMVDLCSTLGIGYVPFGPLSGSTSSRATPLFRAAESVNATTTQVALAWLLQRSTTMLPIPGTSSVAHLRDNIAAVGLKLAPSTVSLLDGLRFR